MNNKNLIQKILEKVKQNKKYSSITDDIIISEIKKYLSINPKITSSDKETIKDIRAKLHRLYSSYQTKKKRKRELYLRELKTALSQRDSEDKLLEITNNLLSLTISTKERLNDYPTIYKQIFKLTGNPETIIDLGAGLNPLSIPYMNLKKLNYYSYDIDEKDISFLNQYFSLIKNRFPELNAEAYILDVRNISKISFPDSDIAFLFKLIDLIDTKKEKISEPLIKLLIKKTKFIIASFATKTLTKKSMNLPRRRGFELMLERNNLLFKTIMTDNEIFYVIS